VGLVKGAAGMARDCWQAGCGSSVVLSKLHLKLSCSAHMPCAVVHARVLPSSSIVFYACLQEAGRCIVAAARLQLQWHCSRSQCTAFALSGISSSSSRRWHGVSLALLRCIVAAWPGNFPSCVYRVSGTRALSAVAVSNSQLS
jgi:hypothetical protein